MFRPRRLAVWLIIVALYCGFMNSAVDAGMPSPLPTNWTAERGPNGDVGIAGMALRIQAISFFVAVLLFSGWLVKGLWNFAKRDFPQLPMLTYGRALGLVFLWGLSFVIVLTMISGARELMTPGAWRKQGWTYQLAANSPPDADGGRKARHRQLEELRTALWQFAATHEGRLPTPDEPSIDGSLWEIPEYPGLKFLMVPNCKAESTGRLFVFEPNLENEERMVLLTNGFIGSMSSAAIKQALSETRHGNDSQSQEVAP